MERSLMLPDWAAAMKQEWPAEEEMWLSTLRRLPKKDMSEISKQKERSSSLPVLEKKIDHLDVGVVAGIDQWGAEEHVLGIEVNVGKLFEEKADHLL